MSRLSLLLVCLALFVCVSFASSATPSPAVQKTRLAAKSNSNAQQSSSVVAVSKATAEAKVGILAFGVWLHDKAPVTEDRSLLKLHAKVAHPKDGQKKKRQTSGTLLSMGGLIELQRSCAQPSTQSDMLADRSLQFSHVFQISVMVWPLVRPHLLTMPPCV